MQNDLLFGKNQTENIVSIEVKDESAELFIQQEDGSVKSEFVPNKFWILSNEKVHSNWTRLKGDLYYKFGKQFNTREEWQETKYRNKKRDLFSIYDPKESLQVLRGYTYYKGLTPQDISILSFDLETTGLDPRASGAQTLLISNTFRQKDTIIRKLFAYDEFDSEADMIDAWCDWVREMNPSILCGHHINGFDIPFLKGRAEELGTSLNLGRDGSDLRTNLFESQFRKDGSQSYGYFKNFVYGREIVDTYFLAIKADIARKYESYGLKQIIKQEGLEKANRTFYDASQIRFNYKKPEEWAKIKEYCKDDSDDSLALFDLFVAPFFYSAQMIPKPFQMITESATGSQINSIMMRAYLQNGHSLPKESEQEQYEGALTGGNVGIYKNIFKVDVASLYPSIMIQYEVYDDQKDPNRYFLDLVKTLTEQRLQNKKKAKDTGERYYKDLEQSQKILINSCYGFLGSKGLLFNSPKKASFVTEKGREILQQSIDWCRSKNFTIVNYDTDSVAFTKHDQSFIPKEERNELLRELNSLYPEKIRFEDDGYYIHFIVSAAKNYILKSEDGKVKIKGSSLKDSKKEPALIEFLRAIIDEMLNETYDYAGVYNRYVQEILNLKEIRRWCSKKTVTDKVLNGTRTNETKVLDAIVNSEYKEGDKIYTYFDVNDNLKLAENYNKDHNIKKLLGKLYKSALTFDAIIPSDTFVNYSLVKNYKKLMGEK